MADIVHELAVSESHIIRCDNDDTVTVTPIDANHCPGAAMFLFEGRFGCILYTGDFRYSGPMVYDMQLNSLCSGKVDVLYLDNTFCDPRCIFPSREEAVVKIMHVIRSYPEAQIKIGLRSLGKEMMLVHIAHGVDEWIGVSQERYEVLELLCLPNVFQVSSSCRIQVVKMSEITTKRMMDWNHEQQTVAVIPTGIGKAFNTSTFPQRDDVYVIPYSDHSSYEELQQFVSFIEPRKIYPILGPHLKDRLAVSLPNRADMSCFHVNVGDVDQVDADGNNDDVMSEQQALTSSSCNTDMNESATETTQSRTKKTIKRKGEFSFKKKTQMGVIFLSSQSPIKRGAAGENIQTVVSVADSGGTVANESETECDIVVSTPTKLIRSDDSDATCDTTTERNDEEGQYLPPQCDSVQLASDKSLMTSRVTENGSLCSNDQDKSALNFDLVDNEWMLQVVQPLIVEEAQKTILERQSFCRPFRK